MSKLTRSVVLKTKFIIRENYRFRFGINKKISEKLSTQGQEYFLMYSPKNYDFSLDRPRYSLTSDLFTSHSRSRQKIEKIDGFTTGIYGAYAFKSVREAKEWLYKYVDLKAIKIKNYRWEILASYDKYSCGNKSTFQIKTAEKWYKNYRILKNNQDYIFFLIEPGKGYIDLSKFQYNSVYKTISPLKIHNSLDNRDTDYIIRINTEGKIIGVVINNKNQKRKLISTDHWDNISIAGYYAPGHGDYIDACCKIKVIDNSNNFGQFCKETMANIRKSEMKEFHWESNGFYDMACRLTNLRALENWNREFQNRDCLDTKRSKEICDYLKDIPFDEEHCVVPFKNGYIARFGKKLQAFAEYHSRYDVYSGKYVENKDSETCSVINRPEYTEKVKDGVKVKELEGPLLAEKWVEGARLWLSNNFDIRSVCVSTNEGKNWISTRIDLCDNRWSSSPFSPPDTGIKLNENSINMEQFNKQVYEKLFSLHPKLKYLMKYTEKHPSLYRGNDIKFLRSLFNYQKIIETFISLGKDDIFWKTDKSYSYHDELTEYWDFEKFKEVMNLNRLPSIKSSMNMYQILGISKPQFNIIFNNPNIDWEHAMHIINGIDWCTVVPNFPTNRWGSRDEYRSAYPTIPADAMKNIVDCAAKLLESTENNTWSVSNLFGRLMYYGIDHKHLYKYIFVKKVDLQLYKDYLAMRAQIMSWLPNEEKTRFENVWDKHLDDADDVRFSHDRISTEYEIQRANRDRWAQEREKERIRERQKKYEERYKKLKSFNYIEADDEHCVVVPKNLSELVTEGQVLHHCAGSFVDSVSEGRDTIVFLRSKNSPDTPYVTVAILYDKTSKQWFVDQAHTARNGDITSDDVAFLKRWGQKNNVLQSSIHERYSAKCHH